MRASSASQPRQRGGSRKNAAHIRKSRPDSGLGSQVQALETFKVVPSWLESGEGFGLRVDLKRSRGGPVFEAHRLYVSLNSIGLKVIKKRQRLPRAQKTVVQT